MKMIRRDGMDRKLKWLLILICILAAFFPALARAEYYMKIHLSNGSTWACDLSDIKKLTFNFTGVSDADLGKLNGFLRPLVLLQNYPNPFSPATNIGYTLPHPMVIDLKIYNITGQLVRSLDAGMKPAGDHRTAWNGRDDRGRQAANGVYLYRLTAGDRVLTKKMVILK